MHTHGTTLVSALLAIAALSVAVSSATANSLTGNSVDVHIIWEEGDQVLNFSPLEIACAMTLSGRFAAARISKVRGSLIGSITQVIVDEAGCQNGTLRAYNETLPWRIRFNAYSGDLPEITGVELELANPQFLIDVPGVGVSCSTSPEAITVGNVSIAEGVVTEISPDETAPVPIDDLTGSILCDVVNVGTFAGSAGVGDDASDRGTVRLTLI